MPLGPRIRAAREQGGLTLRALAERADLSPSFVSQLERGLVNPSLESLRRIAVALGIPLFELFTDGDRHGPGVVRRDARVQVSSPRGGISYERLSSGSAHFELLEGVLEPGGSSSPTPWTHPSEECVTVIVGSIQVEVGGEVIPLSEGDSCSFDSQLPHRYLNHTDTPARFVLAVTPPSY